MHVRQSFLPDSNAPSPLRIGGRPSELDDFRHLAQLGSGGLGENAHCGRIAPVCAVAPAPTAAPQVVAEWPSRQMGPKYKRPRNERGLSIDQMLSSSIPAQRRWSWS